jgi:hypothetical protein
MRKIRTSGSFLWCTSYRKGNEKKVDLLIAFIEFAPWQYRLWSFKSGDTKFYWSMCSKESSVFLKMEWWHDFQHLIYKYFSKKTCPNKKVWVNFSLKLWLVSLVLFLQVMYKKVYFVKICLNFVDSPSFYFKIYQRILWNTSIKSVCWILYPWTWNSTTGIAILHNVSKVPLHVLWLTYFKE